MVRLIACTVLVGVVHSSQAGVPAPQASVDEVLAPWLAGDRMNPDLWRVEGESQYDRAKLSGSCDSLLAGYALLLSAANHGVEVDVPEWDSTRCERTGYFVAFEEGQRAFDQGQIPSAIAWYHRALDASFTAKQRADTKNNIGLCHYWQYDLEPALEWLVASKDEGMEFQSGNSLNTLASVFLSLGGYADALEYAQAAEAKLLDEFNAGGLDLGSFVMYRDLILLNQCAAHLELGQPSDARQRLDQAQLESFFPGLAPEFFHMAFILAWEFDDPGILLAHEGPFGAALLEDSLNAVARFGPVLGLIAPWRSALGGTAQEVWQELRRLAPEQLPELPPSIPAEASAGRRWPMPFWVLLAGGLLLAGVGALFGVRRWQRGRLRSAVGQADLDLALIQSAMQANATPELRDRAWANLRKVKMGRSMLRELQELSQRERDVLRAAIRGERPKETAARLGLRISSVYTLRTAVRSKLGVSKDIELESWIQSEWKS